MSSFTRGAPTETADSTATGPWPRFYQVTIISDGRLRDAAHTDRRITLKARSRSNNESGRVDEHPAPIHRGQKPLGGQLEPINRQRRADRVARIPPFAGLSPTI